MNLGKTEPVETARLLILRGQCGNIRQKTLDLEKAVECGRFDLVSLICLDILVEVEYMERYLPAAPLRLFDNPE